MFDLGLYKKLLPFKFSEHNKRTKANHDIKLLTEKLEALREDYRAKQIAGACELELAGIVNQSKVLKADLATAELALSLTNSQIVAIDNAIKGCRDRNDIRFNEEYKRIRDNFNNVNYSNDEVNILDSGVRAVVSDIPLNYQGEALPLLDSTLADPDGSVDAFRSKLWSMKGRSDDQVRREMKLIRGMIEKSDAVFDEQATDGDEPDEFRGQDYQGDINAAAAALYSVLRGNSSAWRNGVYRVLRTEIAQISKGGRTDNLNVDQIDIIIRLSNWLRPVARKHYLKDGTVRESGSVRWCWFAPYTGYSAAGNYVAAIERDGEALKDGVKARNKAAKALIDSGAVRLIDSKGVPQN